MEGFVCLCVMCACNGSVLQTTSLTHSLVNGCYYLWSLTRRVRWCSDLDEVSLCGEEDVGGYMVGRKAADCQAATTQPERDTRSLWMLWVRCAVEETWADTATGCFNLTVSLSFSRVRLYSVTVKLNMQFVPKYLNQQDDVLHLQWRWVCKLYASEPVCDFTIMICSIYCDCVWLYAHPLICVCVKVCRLVWRVVLQ